MLSGADQGGRTPNSFPEGLVYHHGSGVTHIQPQAIL